MGFQDPLSKNGYGTRKSFRQPNRWVREARMVLSANDRADGLYQRGIPAGKVCSSNKKIIRRAQLGSE